MSSQFATPRTIEEAIALLAKHGSAARVVAGATDLIVQGRLTGSYPELYVDIKHIPEVNVIDLQDDWLQIGAAVSCAKRKVNRPVKIKNGFFMLLWNDRKRTFNTLSFHNMDQMRT